MSQETLIRNNRVLVIDDSTDILMDYRKILDESADAGGSRMQSELARLRAAVFQEAAEAPRPGSGPAAAAQVFRVEIAQQGQEGAAKVRAALEAGEPYAVAFVDMRMPPGWDGLRTIQELWRIDAELQIVICTAHADNPWKDIEDAARGTDRLLVLKKPFDAVEVRRLAATLCAKWSLARRAAERMTRLEHTVAERTAQLELARRKDELQMEELAAVVEQRTAELRRAATHDALTGLPNRTLLHDRLSQALAHAARVPDFHVAVLFLDFDRFKAVNDSMGHEIGDLLLQMIGARLAGVLRNTDTVSLTTERDSTAARLGGDEFCLLLTGLRRREDACLVAQRIIAELEKPYRLGTREVNSTASIGIAVSITGRERAEDLLRDADTAMYRAKAEGKGRFIMFDRAMHEEALSRLSLESELRQAVGRGELRTFYQPLVSLISGEMLGTEALVRWMHPQRGCISPGAFIKIAEETGIIDSIGLWVIEDACGQFARWRKRLPRTAHMRLNVNVSNRQLCDADFPAQLEQILSRTGLPPEALVLEITEHLLMSNASQAREVLGRIKGLGVRTFLDDFGTGYSSLSVLHSFALDGLKIDRSFIMDASGRRRYAAIIHTIMNLAANLGMEGVAEGVESIEQVALLQALGCAKAQGYLFSPPVNAEEMEWMLRQNTRMWTTPNMSAA